MTAVLIQKIYNLTLVIDRHYKYFPALRLCIFASLR